MDPQKNPASLALRIGVNMMPEMKIEFNHANISTLGLLLAQLKVAESIVLGEYIKQCTIQKEDNKNGQ